MGRTCRSVITRRGTCCGSSSDTEGSLTSTEAIKRTFLVASKNAMLGEPSRPATVLPPAFRTAASRLLEQISERLEARAFNCRAVEMTDIVVCLEELNRSLRRCSRRADVPARACGDVVDRWSYPRLGEQQTAIYWAWSSARSTRMEPLAGGTVTTSLTQGRTPR
jgi:hypothetical protein